MSEDVCVGVEIIHVYICITSPGNLGGIGVVANENHSQVKSK